MAHSQKDSEREEKRDPFIQRESPVEKTSTPDGLNLMHGWRFVPDEIELKKRMLYALAVGFECLSIWVYKQILPYMEKYGSEEFEFTIFPKLLNGQLQSKYAITEIRQEIEKNIVSLVKQMYGVHAEVFLNKEVEKSKIEKFSAEFKGPVKKGCSRVLYCMLELLVSEIEESDIRTIELIVFLAQVLDKRIFDYLISYFHNEKDLLLEILLVKMKYRQMAKPEQKHLTEKDIKKLFNRVKEIKYTVEEEEDLAKKIILELSSEVEVSSVIFFNMRGLLYIKCKPDEGILQKMIEKLENKNKAVRMQCVIILQAFAQFNRVIDALIRALADPDDDIKNQARVSLAVAIPTVLERKEELIDLYIKWLIDENCNCIEQLPDILITAKKINHPKHVDLYKEYCLILEEETVSIQVLLIEKIGEVFELYINPEDLLKEDLMEMKIEDKKTLLNFPSPDITQKKVEKPEHIYTPERAVCALERLLNIFTSSRETVESALKILPAVKDLVRPSFIQKTLHSLYEKDPGRNWRYWISLLEVTETLSDILTEANKEKTRTHIKRLTKHWASVVRAAAQKKYSLFE